MRIGIDLGGTKIEVAALDDGGEFLLRRRVPTPAGRYRDTVEAVGDLIDGAEDELGRAASVGIGIPGSISPSTGLVRNANSTNLIGEPLQEHVQTRLGRPVRLANDADCFALSEARGGAADGARVAFAVILGTGVGGGIAIDGKAFEGRNHIAGEWGHTPLPWVRDDERPGPVCYCGRLGCIEAFLSGPRLSAQFKVLSGRKMTPTEIGAAAEAGDVQAEAALQIYEDRLARSLSVICDILDPDVIVFGGGVSNLERLYFNIPPLLANYAFADRIDTPILRARFGDSSGVRGAAML